MALDDNTLQFFVDLEPRTAKFEESMGRAGDRAIKDLEDRYRKWDSGLGRATTLHSPAPPPPPPDIDKWKKMSDEYKRKHGFGEVNKPPAPPAPPPPPPPQPPEDDDEFYGLRKDVDWQKEYAKRDQLNQGLGLAGMGSYGVEIDEEDYEGAPDKRKRQNEEMVKDLTDPDQLKDINDQREKESKLNDDLNEVLKEIIDSFKKFKEELTGANKDEFPDLLDSVGIVSDQFRKLDEATTGAKKVKPIEPTWVTETLEEETAKKLKMEKARERSAKEEEAEYDKQKYGGRGGKAMASMLGGAAKGGEGLGTLGQAAADGGSMLGALGQGLGTAIGGPIGGMIGEKLAKEIPGAIAKPAKMASEALDVVGKSLSGLQGQLGPVGVGFDLLGGSLGKMKDVLGVVSPLGKELLGPMFDALAVIPGQIKGILETLSTFGGMASPAMAKQMSIAVEDVQAVIGHAFLPAMDLMRQGIRLFGDLMANILPNTAEVNSALGELRNVFIDFQKDMREVMREVGPAVREMVVGGLRVLGREMGNLLKITAQLTRSLFEMSKPLLEMLGLNVGKGDLRSSEGAAARGVTMQDFLSYQKELQISAFKEPGAVTQENVPSMVSRIEGLIQDLVNYVKTFTLQGLAASIVQAINAAKAQAITAGTDAVDKQLPGFKRLADSDVGSFIKGLIKG